MKPQITSRQRVRTTLACAEPDRVPINYSANPGIDLRLKAHFNLAPNDHEGLLQALGVDFRGIGVPYVGPRLHADEPKRGVTVDIWGRHRRYIEHESGGYWDFCDFPLENATIEEVAAWPLPNPGDFEYTQVEQACNRYPEHALFVGGPGLGDIINSNGMVRGVEQTLVDLVTDDPAGLSLAARRTQVQLAITERTLAAAKGRIDFLWMGEDLGSQIAPLISLSTYRKHIRPLHQQFVDLAKAYNLPVMIHTCGSSSWAYEDFIAMGINAVDTLQPEATNMSPEYLKQHFGGRLAFHGCISTAGPVTFGCVADVDSYCQQTLETMMPGGGYCFAPTHQLQDNSPTENVVTMYEAAHKYGKY